MCSRQCSEKRGYPHKRGHWFGFADELPAPGILATNEIGIDVTSVRAENYSIAICNL
jgi:hypothetical protein